MNGKIALIISIVALLSVGYLLMNNSSAKTIEPEITASIDSLDLEPAVKALSIAFINNDSLYLKSEYILDKQDELLKAQRRAQRKVENKIKNAEAEVAKMYEEMASYTTQQQQMDAQARYQELEIGLQKLQEREAEKLSNIQMEYNNNLIKKLDGYFDDFCTENEIDYLFTKGPGLSFLYGNKTTDMTKAFIDEINIKYKAELDSLNSLKDNK